MLVQRAALIFGVVFVAVGLLGFVASGGSMEADPAMAPLLLGLFPVNVLHNLVHLGFGAWGLVASRSWNASKTYLVAGGAIYAVLAVLGLIAPDLFGLVPIGGNDIWLHALLAVAMLAIGLTARTETARAGI